MSDTLCPSSPRRSPAARGTIWCGRFFYPDPSSKSMPALLPSHSKDRANAIHSKTVVKSKLELE